MDDQTDVLSEQQLELLRNAQQGRLRCPDCGESVEGEFVYMPGFFVGIVLSCSVCSSVDALSAPVRRPQVEQA